MKVTELRIGNWVLFYNRPAQVGRLTKITIALFRKGEGYPCAKLWGDDTDKCEPIPITPEILEKNGFGYVESDSELSHYYLGEPHYCADMNLHIGTDRKGCFWLNYFNNSIYGLRYVHELQNALQMCGIDKQITL